MEDLREEDYEVYEPLLEGLKPYKSFSSYMPVDFLTRRILLVCVIIFMNKLAHVHWQAMIYMVSSLLTCIKLAALQPYDTKYQNRVEIGNELNVLLVGYLACQILYSSHSAEMMHNVGLFIVIVILGSVAINLTFVIFFLLKEMKNRFLNCKKKRLAKLKQKKLAELDQSDSKLIKLAK